MPERALPSGRGDATPNAGLGGAPRAATCPSCGQRFSPDARFCPFDGETLGPTSDAEPPADPLIGTTVDGRYTVEAILGEGGMGTVYRVRHRALGRGFAMKVMRAQIASDRVLAQRFIQEAKATAAVFHPNLVQITDFGELPGGAPYFVMELLDGQPLSRILHAGGPLPSGRAVRLLRQAAAGLAAAHAGGIVHRDLKPDNLHVTSGDVVKILDFGVAKLAGSARLTRTGMVFGTPHYMSPEQASGQTVDHRTDIYALGIIMYEMFTGRVPFEADTYMGVLTKHMFVAPEPPSTVSAAARELGALEDVTLKCLEKKPEARYASMEELAAEIESVVRLASDGSMELLRSSRRSSAPRPQPIALADELEPPGGDEVRAALHLAHPPISRTLVFGGAAMATVAVGAIGWLLARPARSDVPLAPLAASAAAPIVAASAVDAAAQPAEPRPSAPSAPIPAPAASTAAPIASGAAARPSSPVPASPRPRPRPTAAAKASSRAASPAPAPASFGGGEIINPWSE